MLEEEEGPDQSTSLGDADSPVSSTGSNRMLTLKRAETLAKHVLQVRGWACARRSMRPQGSPDA